MERAVGAMLPMTVGAGIAADMVEVPAATEEFQREAGGSWKRLSCSLGSSASGSSTFVAPGEASASCGCCVPDTGAFLRKLIFGSCATGEGPAWSRRCSAAT